MPSSEQCLRTIRAVSSIRAFARQALAQFRGKIRHARKIKAALGVQRMIDLRAAISRLAKRFKKCAQLFRGFPQEILGTSGRGFRFCEAIFWMIARPIFAIFISERETLSDIIECLEWFFVRAGGERDGTNDDATTDNR